MKIAIDAMGGDHAPKEIVEGAIQAIRLHPEMTILLVGDENEIKQYVPQPIDGIQIIHTDEQIGANEEPVKAVRRKKKSSLVTVARFVRDGEADACISAGNTGAYMTAGLLVVGRLAAIERPALATIMPTNTDKVSLVLDVGANVDAKPQHLLQYAQMGAIYAEKILGLTRPTVGLLNVGTEQAKGNERTKHTYALLENANIHFVGNVEARDIPFAAADVVVCDGFSGNVLLKSAEGVAQVIVQLLREELQQNWIRKTSALILKPVFRSLKTKIDYSEYGGAPLLGLNGICIKAHGSSNSVAIKNAVRQCRKLIQQQMIASIKEEVGKAGDV